MGYYNGFLYTYDAGADPKTCVIFKYDNKLSSYKNDLVIPAQLGKDTVYNVVGIQKEAFLNMSSLTSVTFGESSKTPKSYLIDIGESAFQGCSGLKKIDFSSASALETIGKNAFMAGITLSTSGKLEFPASLKTIGENAFRNVKGYTAVTFEDTTSNPSHLTEIGKNAFMGPNLSVEYPTNLVDLTLPRSLTKINEAAFAWAPWIKSVTFTNTGNINIGKYAFSRATFLRSVTFSSATNAVTTFDSDSGGMAFEYIGCPDGSDATDHYYDHETLTSLYLKSGTVVNSSDLVNNSDRVVVYRGDTTGTAASSTLNTINTAYESSTPPSPEYWDVSPNFVYVNRDSTGTDTTVSGKVSTTQNTLIHFTSSDGHSDFDFLANITDKKLILTRYIYHDPTTATNLTATVPGTIKINSVDYTVTSIGDNAFYLSMTNQSNGNGSLKKVKLTDNITSIGKFAFSRNSYLTDISTSDTDAGKMPSSLASIGRYALSWTAITAATFTSSLATMGEGAISAFGDNSSLTKLSIGTDSACGYSTSKDTVLYHGATLSWILNSCAGALTITAGTTDMNEAAGQYKSLITSVSAPSSLKYFSGNAFCGIAGLKSVTITDTTESPSVMTEFKYNSFWHCTSLTTINYPKSLTAIRSSAFEGDTALTNGDLSATSLTTLEAKAFSGCSGLKSVKLPNTLTKLPLDSFKGFGSGTADTVTETPLDLGTGLTEIGESSFNGSTKIKSLTLPASLTSIGINAFYNDIGITTIDFTNVSSRTAQLTINKAAFYNNRGVSKIILPKNVTFSGIDYTSTDTYPFYNCFSSATQDTFSSGGIFLMDSEKDYIGTNASHYIEGWNGRSYSSSTINPIPFRWHANSASDQASGTSHDINSAYYWHFVNGVPTQGAGEDSY
jgi:hypothetical protein